MIEQTVVEPGSKTTLSERAADFVRGLGLEYFAYMTTRLPPGSGCKPEQTIATNYPTSWIERYVAKSYRLYDPVIDIARRARLPFQWGQGAFLRPFGKAQRRVFREAAEYRINGGYSVPIYGPDGESALFSVAAASCGNIGDAVRVAAPRIQLFAVQFHAEALRSLPVVVKPSSRELTLRERECLRWTADGLTTDEVSLRVYLSPSAVNYHLGNAARKLGACNKLHAAILALREGRL